MCSRTTCVHLLGLDSPISCPGLTIPATSLLGPNSLPPSRHCSHHSRRWIASPGTVPSPASPPNMTSEACSLRPPGVWWPLRGSRYLILQISCSFKTYQEGSGSGQARGTQDSACQHACNCSRANGGAAMLFRATKRHGYDDQSLESLSGMTL